MEKGITGTIILGPKLVKTFTALPEHYTVTDFDIHIQDSTEVFQTIQEVKGLNMELIKAGMVDVADAIDIATAKNVTDLKTRIAKSMAAKKAENDMITQLQQQAEQMNNQIKQYESQIGEFNNQIKQLQSQVEQNNQAKLELERQRIGIEDREARDKKDYNDKQIKLKEDQIKVEIMQLSDGNPYNNNIRE